MNLKEIIRNLLYPNRMSQELIIRKSDVFLVSFPKSGNTWMRFLLINSILNKKKEDIEYSRLEEFIPSIYKSSSEYINLREGKRIIKSHIVRAEYPKIIYIVRDGRDSLVSYYYYLKDLKGLKGTFKEFYYSENGKAVGMWHEHVLSALEYEKQNKDRIIIIKYEDLKKDTKKELIKVLQFLNVKIIKRDIEFAIKKSSFENLQKSQNKSGILVEGKKINFFRKGTSEQWKEYFDEEMLNDFVVKSAEINKKMNYTGQ